MMLIVNAGGLVVICELLHCWFGDIMEYSKEQPEESGGV